MATCKACDAEVIFAASATSGRSMILNAKVEKRVVFYEQLLEWGKGPYGEQLYVKGEPRASVVDTYISHFATCPNADRFKRAKA